MMMKPTLCSLQTVIAFSVLLGFGSAVASSSLSCRSNTTHIAWTIPQRSGVSSGRVQIAAAVSRLLTGKSSCSCRIQTRKAAERDLFSYLRRHVMQFDLPFLETMGFNDDDDDDDENDFPDGLGSGMIGETIQAALQAKIDFPHSDKIPIIIWREYVLNYANTNEARSNWRPLFWNKLRPLVGPDDTISSVVHTVNAELWKLLAPPDQTVIYFKSGSTPLVFDPMSIMAFGYASCTGCAILFINALRTMGVPARIVGTAAWNQNRSAGNHNWVEVWNDNTWHFLEPSLSGDPNTPADSVDDLMIKPCQKWFCNPHAFTENPSNTTLVYAARLEESARSTYYPIAWEWNNHDVPGEDLSAYYQQICSKC